MSLLGDLQRKITRGDDWQRLTISAGLVFGGLWIAATLGATWAMPLALLIGFGVLVFH